MTVVSPLPKVYLPWVRQGNARRITQIDTLAAGLPARATLSANLRLNGQLVTTKVQLYGPGDVIGLDAGQVRRTEPPDGARNFRPSHFPAIEFVRPDLPWLFTPAKADEQGRLRPWLCLVVVRKRPEINIVSYGDMRLPVIENMPAAELPPLDESWAWAHAQALILPEMIDHVTKDQLAEFLAVLQKPLRVAIHADSLIPSCG